MVVEKTKKTTLTFYLPKETLQNAKILAVRNEDTFSSLAVRSALMLIDDIGHDPNIESPENEEKVLVYLSDQEKQAIKRYAAENALTISEIFYQALELNLKSDQTSVREEIKDLKKKRTKKKPQPAVKKNPFSYNLTGENDRKLRLASLDSGKTRRQLVLEAVETAVPEEILKLPRQAPKTIRSSIDISQDEIARLKKKAEAVDLSVSEFLNRAVASL